MVPDTLYPIKCQTRYIRVAGEDMATSEPFAGFRLNTENTKFLFTEQSDLSTFVEAPITYFEGETVTCIAPDGESNTLVESAGTNGTTEFSPTKGGVWKLVNSRGETVLVGVAWNVFGDNWSQESPLATLFKMQTDTGPDRKTRKNEHPAIAYSGDNWRGDVSKPAVLTFIPPEGSGVESTVLNLTGSGVSQFTFNHPGLWTVTLEMHDDTVHTAKIFIRGGLTVYVR